jgi:hypothetical protein
MSAFSEYHCCWLERWVDGTDQLPAAFKPQDDGLDATKKIIMQKTSKWPPYKRKGDGKKIPPVLD